MESPTWPSGVGQSRVSKSADPNWRSSFGFPLVNPKNNVPSPKGPQLRPAHVHDPADGPTGRSAEGLGVELPIPHDQVHGRAAAVAAWKSSFTTGGPSNIRAWLKIKALGLRRFCSLVPFAKVPFWDLYENGRPHFPTLAPN